MNPSSPPNVLDYAPRRISLIPCFLMHLLIWSLALAVPAVILLFVVPRFEALLRDFKVQLPLVTRLVLQASHALIHQHAWIALPLLPLLLATLSTLASGAPRDLPELRRSYRLTRLLASLLLAALALLLIAALFLPLVNLIDAVAGTSK